MPQSAAPAAEIRAACPSGAAERRARPRGRTAPSAPRRSTRNNIAVEVSGLRKSYGAQTVLDGLDLTVRVGEVVALLGPSGSGKSTLLRCINHLENWDAGTVRVGGRRLGFRDDGRDAVAARRSPTSAPASASAWCFSSSTCSAI